MDGYALIDAGDGRRLERFGDRLVDRPAPAAQGRRHAPAAWAAADLRFARGGGWAGDRREPWSIDFRGVTLELRLAEAGQVGLFPEHANLWPWFAQAVGDRPDRQVLHLFAYTGATTLALARLGAGVTHVDAARSAVAWARLNAKLSGLADRPIRWIVDDAAAFVGRELRRGRVYDGIVMDPPSYGHAAGRSWRLEADLSGLLEASAKLLRPGGWLLVTTHSTGWGSDRLRRSIHALGVDTAAVDAGELTLVAAGGAALPSGAFARAVLGR